MNTNVISIFNFLIFIYIIKYTGMSAKMKPSAYKSMVLAKENKTKDKDGKLKTWINEKWRNLTPITIGDNKFYECGRKSADQIKQGLPSVCRPTVKINESTPSLAQTYTKAQIKKAVNIKRKDERIMWNKL